MSMTLQPDNFIQIHKHLPPMIMGDDGVVTVKNYKYKDFTLGYDLKMWSIEEALYELNNIIRFRKGLKV